VCASVLVLSGQQLLRNTCSVCTRYPWCTEHYTSLQQKS